MVTMVTVTVTKVKLTATLVTVTVKSIYHRHTEVGCSIKYYRSGYMAACVYEDD